MHLLQICCFIACQEPHPLPEHSTWSCRGVDGWGSEGNRSTNLSALIWSSQNPDKELYSKNLWDAFENLWQPLRWFCHQSTSLWWRNLPSQNFPKPSRWLTLSCVKQLKEGRHTVNTWCKCEATKVATHFFGLVEPKVHFLLWNCDTLNDEGNPTWQPSSSHLFERVQLIETMSSRLLQGGYLLSFRLDDYTSRFWHRFRQWPCHNSRGCFLASCYLETLRREFSTFAIFSREMLALLALRGRIFADRRCSRVLLTEVLVHHLLHLKASRNALVCLINSLQSRVIVKISGFTRCICESQWF